MLCLGAAGAGAILSSGLLKLASFETVKAFVDAAMQGDPAKTVMSGGVFVPASRYCGGTNMCCMYPLSTS